MTAQAAFAQTPLDALSNLDSIRRRILDARQVFLFADFDGTVAPIVSIPSLAAMPPDLHSIFRTFSLIPHVVTAIISGRTVSDLQARVGLPLIYAGNHGLEIQGPGLQYTVPAAEQLHYQLMGICNDLRHRLGPVPGAQVECKRLTVSVHFRHVAREEVASVAAIVESTLQPYPAFQVSRGKEVLEIRPRIAWNKGTAARWILERAGGEETGVICLGDDSTDEDMFADLKDGISVRIGFGQPTCARYWMGDADVPVFLCSVLDMVRARGAAK